MNFTTRSRWAAVGAAIAITLGAGGIGVTHATSDAGDGPVSAFFPIEPCRLAENIPVGPDRSITLDGWGTTGDCTLPTGTTGLAANVTAVNASQQTNLRFYAQGDDVPGTANLNPSPGAAPTPNAVNITLNTTNGKFQVYNRFGTVAVYIDIMGYYDDHTHDDRYYTETETDASVALATTRVASAAGADSTLVSSAEVVRSATIQAPTAGTVLATSSATGVLSVGDEMACSLELGSSRDTSYSQYAGNQGSTTVAGSVANVRAFDVAAGSITVNLVCEATQGADVSVLRPQMSALFVPN